MILYNWNELLPVLRCLVCIVCLLYHNRDSKKRLKVDLRAELNLWGRRCRVCFELLPHLVPGLDGRFVDEIYRIVTPIENCAARFCCLVDCDEVGRPIVTNQQL